MATAQLIRVHGGLGLVVCGRELPGVVFKTMDDALDFLRDYLFTGAR